MIRSTLHAPDGFVPRACTCSEESSARRVPSGLDGVAPVARPMLVRSSRPLRRHRCGAVVPPSACSRASFTRPIASCASSPAHPSGSANASSTSSKASRVPSAVHFVDRPMWRFGTSALRVAVSVLEHELCFLQSSTPCCKRGSSAQEHRTRSPPYSVDIEVPSLDSTNGAARGCGRSTMSLHAVCEPHAKLHIDGFAYALRRERLAPLRLLSQVPTALKPRPAAHLSTCGGTTLPTSASAAAPIAAATTRADAEAKNTVQRPRVASARSCAVTHTSRGLSDSPRIQRERFSPAMDRTARCERREKPSTPHAGSPGGPGTEGSCARDS